MRGKVRTPESSVVGEDKKKHKWLCSVLEGSDERSPADASNNSYTTHWKAIKHNCLIASFGGCDEKIDEYKKKVEMNTNRRRRTQRRAEFRWAESETTIRICFILEATDNQLRLLLDPFSGK